MTSWLPPTRPPDNATILSLNAWLNPHSLPTKNPEPKPGGGSTCDVPSPCEVDAHSDSPPNAHGRSSLTAPEPKPGGGSTCDAPSPCEVDAHSDSPPNAHGRSRLTAPEPKPGGGSTCDAPSPCEVGAHSDSPSNAHEGLSLTAPEPEPSEQPLASSREHPPLPDLDEYETTSDMDCDDERWECDTDVLSDVGSHPNTHTNVKALRERKHIYQISYHQNGNYHPVDTHGAARCNPGPLLQRFEQPHDCQHLRPPGSRNHRAASFFSGCVVMCEAGRRAKMSVCFAAEKNRALHADYHYNTGVVPYNSNAALLHEIPDDIDVYLFGSNYRSVSRAGLKRCLGQTDDWEEFDRVVTHMRTTARHLHLHGNGSTVSQSTVTARRPRNLLPRLGGLANTAPLRRAYLHGYGLTASPSGHASKTSPTRQRLDGLANTATARRSHLYRYGSTACCPRLHGLTTSPPRQRLDGLANPATAARRCHLYGHGSTASPTRLQLDGITSTATARRYHLYGYSSTVSPLRPQVDSLTNTAIARRSHLYGHGSTPSPPRQLLDSFAIHCYGSTPSPPRPRLDIFTPTATARQLRNPLPRLDALASTATA